jgi:transposase-like protein
MYVTVSLKMDLNATTNLHQLESQIQETGREAMKAALQQAIHQLEEHEKSCPHCGSTQVQTRGTKRRILLTSFGRVEVPLKRLRCLHCGQRFRPADVSLAEICGHNITESLRDLATLVGSSWPYETAAGVLKRLSGVQLSDERLRQLTNDQGSALAQQQHSEAQQVVQEAVNMQQAHPSF